MFGLGFGIKGLPSLASELKDLTVNYAKQETLEPLKNLGRYVAFGFAGSLLLAAGLTLWVVAGLRALQEETGSAFTGHLTWVPYLITLVGTTLIITISFFAIGAEKRRAKERRNKRETAKVES